MIDGIYDRLLDSRLSEGFVSGALTRFREVESEELSEYLVLHFLAALRSSLEKCDKDEHKINLVNSLVQILDESGVSVSDPKVLTGFASNESGRFKIEQQPNIPLSQLALLTNLKGSPSVGAELKSELLSSDRVDILMAFVKQSGLNHFASALRALRDRGVEIRLITSAYLGATQVSALNQLVDGLGVKVKVDYLARANRLHAKAWLLERETGYSTAFIGSSNISSAAMTDGLEWNVRFSEVKSPEILQVFRATFDSYWSSGDFIEYLPSRDQARLEEALLRARGSTEGVPTTLSISGLEVRPYPFQQRMLSEINAEREIHGRHRNLVVAATGTGKTVLSALDYRMQSVQLGRRQKLLFVAHTKEILTQALRTFREVMRDPSFGELLVDGLAPTQWSHVFASIQSLRTQVTKLPNDHFEFVIVDEFHHASADSYKEVLNYLAPHELVGLTATPERTDGIRVQDEFFDGRIATELRLWDALDQELLTPFNYFAIAEDTDFTQVSWRSGGYATREVSQLVTGNEIRDRLVLREIGQKFGELGELKALVFCVDISHAEHINQLLNKSGIPASSLTSLQSSFERDLAVSRFRAGEVKALVSVDILSEGFDAPDANAVVMLRPTESPLVFLQQLGRGLRRSPGKTSVLVLDFVGNHRAEYRLDLKLSAITGRPRGQMERDLRSGFPFLPAGVTVELDQLSQSRVLSSLKSQIAPGASALQREVRGSGILNLRQFLGDFGRELWEIYRVSTWSQLCDASNSISDHELAFLNKIKNFLHVNDLPRMLAYKQILSGSFPKWADSSPAQKQFVNMFLWNLHSSNRELNRSDVDTLVKEVTSMKLFVDELNQIFDLIAEDLRLRTYPVKSTNQSNVLRAHANYTRAELLGSFGWSEFHDSNFPRSARENTQSTPSDHREGVAWMPGIKTELLLVTLEKGETFNPSTRYKDFAESQEVFHWESQNRVGSDSATGKRYQNHKALGVEIFLAIRERSRNDFSGFTETFRLAGLVNYLSHKGSHPMQIRWRLDEALDVDTWTVASAIRVA